MPSAKRNGALSKAMPATPSRAFAGCWVCTRATAPRPTPASSNRRIPRAWVLKDEFEHFWNYTYPASARQFLKRWMTSALKTRIPSLRKFAATLKLHQDNILSFIQRPLTNAVGEGINRIIKIVKNRASGFRTLEPFTDLIFLTVGDFDILAHIPSPLRSI